MPKLNSFNISKLGVDVDKAPLFLEDGELSKAQNAIRDGIGDDGVVRKRPGLVGFNGSAAAGSIIGGVGVPLAYQGPAAVHTIYLGLFISNTSASGGWHTSVDAFATESQILSGVPANPVDLDNLYTSPREFSSYFSWARQAVTLNNRLYYASDNYTLFSTSPSVRVYDGTFDELLARVPPPAAGGVSAAIVTMAALHGTIFLTTFDTGRGLSNNMQGRVFSLTPDGVMAQLGAAFPAGSIPFSLAWAFGRLWCGTNAGTGGTVATAEIYWIRPGLDTAWTLDRTETAKACMSMVSYKGVLYAGFVTTAASAALVKARTALGVWSTADTGAAGAGTDSSHGYGVLGVFGTNLYAIRHGENAEGTKVRKFDGTTWSTVHTIASGAAGDWHYTNWLNHNGVVYVTTSKNSGFTMTVMGLKTTDGTTWSAILIPAVNSNYYASPALGVLVS